MVVPERSLVNTTFSFDLSILSNPQEPFNNMAIDMEVDTPRGWSTSTSTNSSRATSAHSNISSTGYTEHIQALANNLTWTDQVEISKSEGPALSSSQTVDLVFLLSSIFIFIFFSVYFPIFLFLEQLGLGLIGHAVTTVI